MATIIRNKLKAGVSYQARVRLPNGSFKKKAFTRKGDALTWAKRIEADGELMEAYGSKAKGVGMSFEQLADEYMLQWRGKDPNQVGKMKFWVDEIGNRKLSDINADLIRKALNDYANGKALRGDGVGKTAETNRTRAPATVNRIRAVLSGTLKCAMQQGYIVSNPVAKVATRAGGKVIERFLSDEERNALLESCKQSDWPKLYLIVLMALTTGARQGELLKLKWSDIDFKERTAMLRDTKNGTSRVLTIPSPTLPELQKHREIGTGLIFPSPTLPDKPYDFDKRWHKALKQAGITDFRFHDLRHSAASYLVMAGAILHETAEVLGHKSIQTTKRYAHLSIDHKRELTEQVFSERMGN